MMRLYTLNFGHARAINVYCVDRALDALQLNTSGMVVTGKLYLLERLRAGYSSSGLLYWFFKSRNKSVSFRSGSSSIIHFIHTIHTCVYIYSIYYIYTQIVRHSMIILQSIHFTELLNKYKIFYNYNLYNVIKYLLRYSI